MFNRGLKILKRAFKQLPLHNHKHLWEIDIEFRTRAGEDISSSINRVKGYDVETQAKVYAMVGHCAFDTMEQNESFRKAIQILDEKPTSKVEYLLEYAIWLFFNNFPTEECITQLKVRNVSLSSYISDCI